MITGRLGHARVIVLCVTENEVAAVRAEFQAYHEIDFSGMYSPTAPVVNSGPTAIFPLLVARCDGRSNMPAMATTLQLIERWRPEFIILCGTAGGILRPTSGSVMAGPALGDVVIADLIHYADYGKTLQGEGFRPRQMAAVHPPSNVVQNVLDQFSLPGLSWPQSLLEHRPEDEGAAPRVHSGEIVAVEAVQGDPTNPHQQWIVEHFDKALCVDMESFGVARALHAYESDVHYHPRWLCVRGISDAVVGETAHLERVVNNNAERRKWESYAAMNAAHVARQAAVRLLFRDRPDHPLQPGAPAWS